MTSGPEAERGKEHATVSARVSFEIGEPARGHLKHRALGGQRGPDPHDPGFAIAAGEAEINQCPPGGEAGIQALADLLGRDPVPLNESHGEHKGKRVARIDESTCIGCTLCLQACPVDAIFPEIDVPDEWSSFIEKNSQLSGL